MVADLTPRLRPSRASDGERVLEIWCDAVDATHDFLSAADRVAIEEQVRGFLPNAPLTLAVDSDDRPLGFMLVDDGHMEALFIDPAVRGLGIGRMLVEHAREQAPDLTTEVNLQNDQAVGFYRHLGFAETGRSEHDSDGRPYPLIHLRYDHNIALSRLRERVG